MNQLDNTKPDAAADIKPSFPKEVRLATNSVTSGGESDFRFEVAMSFAGDNKRDQVRRVATLLQKQLGDGRVFFDEWYTAEIAGLDADLVLQRIYGRETRLIVTCVCQRYDEKPWTQLEWRAIRALEQNLRDASTDNVKRLRILPLRFGDGEVDGLYASSISIVPDVRKDQDQEIADLILERLRLAKKHPSFVQLKRKSIPDAIKKRVKQLKKTQNSVASELGVNKRVLEKCWQGGLVDCDLLERLAKILQCELGDISTAVEPVVVDEVKPTRPDFDPAVGKEQLIPIATRLLAECPEAQASIIEFNKFTDSPSPSQLARRIIESTEPMRFLFNCVDQKYTIESSRAIHHKQCFLALAEVLAPICLTTKNLSSVYATINDSEKHFAEIDTREPLVAKAVVGLIHGVPVDGSELNTWKKLSSTDLRGGRDFAAAVPEPPELGVAGVDIVDVFVKGLAIYLNRPPNVGKVKAALRALKDKGVHLCVLFSESPNPAALKKLKQELTDVILLVGCVNVESDENNYVLEHFQQIKDFFSHKG